MRLIVKAISTIRSRSKQLSAQKKQNPDENIRRTIENISLRWIPNGFIEKLDESGEITGNSWRRWKT